MLHSRHLPIASPCEDFVGREATSDGEAYCTRCEKAVHDLSNMREREAVAFLRRMRGRDVCVSYRTREGGSIEVRPDPRPLAPLGLALSLAACAGHLEGADIAPEDCVDAAGYAVPCPSDPRGDAVVPDAFPLEADESSSRDPSGLDVHEGSGDPAEGDALRVDESSRAYSPHPSEPSIEPASEAASCVVTERMRRREQRRRMFTRGKLAPITDELLCEIEADRLRERAQRRRAR